MTNPVEFALQKLATGLIQLILSGATLALRQIVFRPLTWVPAAALLWTWSRDVAVASMGAAMIVAAARAVWPPLTGVPDVEPWSALAVRAVLAALFLVVVPSALRWLLMWNGMLIQLLLAGRAPTFAAWSSGLIATAPVLVLALGLLMAALVVYLSVLYAVRWVQLGWLVALLPWFAVGWTATGDGRRFLQSLREVVALSMTQAAQVAAWWLAERYLARAATLDGMVIATGGLWFMAQVPGELRRLMGVYGGQGWWR